MRLLCLHGKRVPLTEDAMLPSHDSLLPLNSVMLPGWLSDFLRCEQTETFEPVCVTGLAPQMTRISVKIPNLIMADIKPTGMTDAAVVWFHICFPVVRISCTRHRGYLPFPKGRYFINWIRAVIDVTTSTPCPGGYRSLAPKTLELNSGPACWGEGVDVRRRSSETRLLELY